MDELTRKELRVRILNLTNIENLLGCWLWKGTTVFGTSKTSPYGQMSFKGQRIRAHRAAYLAWVGPIPIGLTVDHLCRKTLCVNPKHLEAVSARENTLRGIGPTAQNARKTHCLQGHEYTAANTGISYSEEGYPKRDCKECRKRINRDYKVKRKQRGL